MDISEVKKLLYKEDPTAKFVMIRKGVAYYIVHIPIIIMFEIPVSDMGDADFFYEMKAKHLIRYIAPGQKF